MEGVSKRMINEPTAGYIIMLITLHFLNYLESNTFLTYVMFLQEFKYVIS